MNLQKITIGVALLALVLSVGAIGMNLSKGKDVLSGGIAGGTLSPTGTILANPSTSTLGEFTQGLLADVQFFLGGATLTTGIDQVASVAACNTATSTVFDVVNPFTATSTVQLWIGNVIGQATTTNITAGTTTKASGLALTDVSPALLNAASVATGTQVSLISGQTATLGSGQVSAGAGTSRTIVVGPGERVAAFATSSQSTTGTGSNNYVPAVSCGAYKLKWEI